MTILISKKKFDSNDEVIAEMKECFEGLKQLYFLERVQKIEKRCTKCIKLNGDYVEK